MKLDWRYSIGIGTLFFVAGQVLLRKSLDNSSDYMISLLYFTSSIAIMTLFGCIYLQENIFDITRLTNQHYNAISAGIVFFFGFIFWIYRVYLHIVILSKSIISLFIENARIKGGF